MTERTVMGRTVKVWDPVVRLFHWGLAVSFAVAWLTAETWDNLHEWVGYLAAALVAVRVFWGLVGSRYARFRQFVRPPAAALTYLRDVVAGRERRYLGHNPAGAVMIVALIAAMAGTALTGWMFTLDAFWGVGWIEDLHEGLASLMLVMVAVHVAGVVIASARHRENLVRAMISGRKRAPEAADIA
jgi:cytochrome b